MNEQTITLDWDNIAFTECKRRIKKIMKNKMIESIEVFESPKGSGYHIFLGLYYQINPAMIRRLRRAWKDDPNRIFVDMDSKSQITRDVMFSEKILIRNNKVIFILPETPMFKYSRCGILTNLWQVTNLQTMEQKKFHLAELKPEVTINDTLLLEV